MKPYYCFYIFTLILLVSLVASKPGGNSKITNPKKYKEAIQLLNSAGLNLKQNGIKVIGINKQVVSGIRYTYSCKIKISNGKFKKCEIQLIDKPWVSTRIKITKNTCVNDDTL